jgi:hypothetical protein
MAGITSSLNITTKPHRHEVAYLAAPPGYRQNAGFIIDLDAGDRFCRPRLRSTRSCGSR